jgi:hypothetical protein
MKTKFFFFFLTVFIIGACTPNKNSRIQGAWRTVYIMSVANDSVNYSFSGSQSEGQIKIWSEDQFSFNGALKFDSLVRDTYGVGTYKLIGTQYEETLLYCFYKPYVGQTLKMTLEFKNDTLIQTSLDDNGKFDKSSYWIEKYVRLY